MRNIGSSSTRKKKNPIVFLVFRSLFLVGSIFTFVILLWISTTDVDPSDELAGGSVGRSAEDGRRPCATVEEMGEGFSAGSERESLRVRGFDQEPLRSSWGFYPFGDFISYSNVSFTLREVKHLWRKNDCAGKYRRNLITRIDNFEHPAGTNVLCSEWRGWKQPIICFQGTTDAVAIQFFLKNIHLGMRSAASILFGCPEALQSRPNVFGELMRILISPSQAIQEVVDWVLQRGDPDVTLHMRMLMNRSIRATKAALNCIKRAMGSLQKQTARPRVVLVSDTPSFIKEITPHLTEFAQVVYFDFKAFQGNVSNGTMSKEHQDKGLGTGTKIRCICGFFSRITCQACCCYWSPPSCRHNLCSACRSTCCS